MKKIIFSFCFVVLAFSAMAQQKPSKKSIKDEKKEARREKIGTLIRQQEEGALIYNKQNVYGLRLNTDGWNLFYEKGILKTAKVANLFSLEIGEKKHPKETKQQAAGNGFFSVGSSYVYGKRNSFYQVKPTFGQQRMIGAKSNKNGVAVNVVYQGGLSIGLLRPYYVRISDPNAAGNTKDIKYTVADSSDFLDNNSILSGTGLSHGWKEMSIVPGVHAKTALRFDYGRFNEMVSAIEVGINVEAYAKKPAIMLLVPQKQIFYNAYVAIMFGKRK